MPAVRRASELIELCVITLFLKFDRIRMLRSFGATSSVLLSPSIDWSIIPLDPNEPYMTGAFEFLQRAVVWCRDIGLGVVSPGPTTFCRMAADKSSSENLYDGFTVFS